MLPEFFIVMGEPNRQRRPDSGFIYEMIERSPETH